MSLVNLTDEDFKEKIAAAPRPLLLFFRADFCAASASMDPLIDRLHEVSEDILDIADIDIEACPLTAKTFQIRALPTFIVMVGNEAKAGVLGSMTYPQLTEVVAGATGLRL